MTTEAQKRAWKKYQNSEKGKAMVKAYEQSENRIQQKKQYQKSEKAKANRKSKPEIYQAGFQKMLTYNVCGILQEHAEKVKEDPERLSTDFILKMSGIRVLPP